MRVGFAELFLIAVGLSMDAFAVSICKGLCMPRLDMRQGAVIALFFGGFQALMPLVGWFVGAQFAHFVTSFAHWIAFALLAFIGAKMLADARFTNSDANSDGPFKLDLKELVMLAVATSIDALAVGVSLAFLDVSIAPAVTLIGVTTFCLSLVGVAIGHCFGARWEKPASLVGGVVLICIGLKILLSGLGVIP